MRQTGIQTSELIKRLEEIVKVYGDREVIILSKDYPEGCEGVAIQIRDEAYVPVGSVVIY